MRRPCALAARTHFPTLEPARTPSQPLRASARATPSSRDLRGLRRIYPLGRVKRGTLFFSGPPLECLPCQLISLFSLAARCVAQRRCLPLVLLVVRGVFALARAGRRVSRHYGPCWAALRDPRFRQASWRLRRETLAHEMEAERGGRGRGRGGRGRGGRGRGSAEQGRRPSGAPRGLEELVYPEYLSAEAAAAGLAVRQRSSKRPLQRIAWRGAEPARALLSFHGACAAHTCF